MKRQKYRTVKDELPRSVGAQYATGEQWRSTSRKNEVMKPKQRQHPAVDATGDGNKVLCLEGAGGEGGGRGDRDGEDM